MLDQVCKSQLQSKKSVVVKALDVPKFYWNMHVYSESMGNNGRRPEDGYSLSSSVLDSAHTNDG